MKNILLFLLFSMNLLSLNGQPLEFPDSNAQWCYQGYGDTGEDLGTFCFFSETIQAINGKDYAKINYREHPFSNPIDIYYRSDSGRCYVLPKDSLNEILVYDFSLEVGDTFSTAWGWALNDTIDLVVQSTALITTLDGIERRKVILSNAEYYGEWLEGVGSLNWVFLKPAYTQSVSGGFTFNCHSKEADLVYDHNGSEACMPTAIIEIKEDQEKEMMIRPNPNHGTFEINFQNLNVNHIKILDLSGAVVFTQNIATYQKSVILNLPISRGLYFLIADLKSGNKKTQRVIIK